MLNVNAYAELLMNWALAKGREEVGRRSCLLKVSCSFQSASHMKFVVLDAIVDETLVKL